MEIKTGKKLFEFRNYDHWSYSAQDEFKNAGVTADETICIDKDGNIYRNGGEFKEAMANKKYPISVYEYKSGLITDPLWDIVYEYQKKIGIKSSRKDFFDIFKDHFENNLKEYTND